MPYTDDTTKILLERRQFLKEEYTRNQNYAKTLKSTFLGNGSTLKDLPLPSAELPPELQASINSISDTASRVNSGLKQVSLNESVIQQHQVEIKQLEEKIKNFYVRIAIAVVVVLILLWILLG